MSAERTLTVNGNRVVVTGTVLQACQEAGAAVPALCHEPGLSTGAHCRSCLVEVDGQLVCACTASAVAGSRVVTDSAALRSYRRDLGELMLAETPSPGGAVGAQLAEWGVTGERYGRAEERGHIDASHPYLRLKLDACIRCRRCELACAEVQGRFVFAMTGRGAETALGWGGGDFVDSACVSCGACVDSCPTEAIFDVDRGDGAQPSAIVRTTCAYCGVGCQLDVEVADDDVARIVPAPEAVVNRGHACLKGRYAHAFARHPDRLTTPLIRRDGVLEPASWDEAIAVVAAAIRRHPTKVGGLSSSRCTNEENYLLQKWIRAGLGTHHIDCCARVCHAPTATGMKAAFGTGAATNSLADLALADVILVAGANATSSHPVVGARIRQQVLRGAARLVVIDPRETELAAIADVHLQLAPGTNVPLLNSLAAVLVEESLLDDAFIAERTDGWAAFRDFIAGFPPEVTEGLTGVPAALVRRAARLYGQAARPLQVHGLGMTEHYQGSEAVMQLANLALLVGGVGRPGVGVNPLRGQNNVQGAADMGCQPNAMTGYGDPLDAEVRARFEAVWGRPISTEPGWTLPKMYDAARRGDLKVLFIMGEDVVQTDPAAHLVGVFEALDLLVVQEIFLSETARRADVVLPAASFLEKDGTFTNGERRIQRVRAAITPPEEARPDWRILCDLMAATGMPQPFTHPSQVMDEIALVAPQFRGVSYDRLDDDGLQWPVPAPNHPGTAVLHIDGFNHGRGRLARVSHLPSPALVDVDPAFPLRLITGRVLEHYNCGTMTRRTDNVRLLGGDPLEMHPTDAAERSIAHGDPVVVTSPWGEAHARCKVTPTVAPGTAFLSFHFPATGTNQLTSNVLDRLADCPEYKVTPVQVCSAR